MTAVIYNYPVNFMFKNRNGFSYSKACYYSCFNNPNYSCIVTSYPCTILIYCVCLIKT